MFYTYSGFTQNYVSSVLCYGCLKANEQGLFALQFSYQLFNETYCVGTEHSPDKDVKKVLTKK